MGVSARRAPDEEVVRYSAARNGSRAGFRRNHVADRYNRRRFDGLPCKVIQKVIATEG